MEYDVLPLDTADVAVYSDVRMSGVLKRGGGDSCAEGRNYQIYLNINLWDCATISVKIWRDTY